MTAVERAPRRAPLRAARPARRQQPAPALELSGVGKRYWQLHERPMLVRSLLPIGKIARTELWALRGVDLKIEPGETVGVLGRNGAGKSTLLRLLAGVAQPTEGTIDIRGRVAPLLSVGVGFHQEMSGRENIYVNGMLLGLSREEIDARFDDIVAFAELADFIDTPVKFYSSGMFMRLGFAVAIHVEPEVLLVDEILAVGDVAFQLKCFERMRAMQERGATIMFVTHSMHAIRLLCPRAVLFGHGQLLFDGPSEEAIALHHELLSTEGEAHDELGAVAVDAAELLDERGDPVHHPSQDDRLTLRLRLRFVEDVDSPQVMFHVMSADGMLAYEMKTVLGRGYRTYRAGETATAEVTFVPKLGGGTWRLQWTITDLGGRAAYYRATSGILLYLPPPLGSAGIADLGATISIDGAPASDHPPLTLGGGTEDNL